MQSDEFDELAMFRAISASGARALLIGRRAVILHGVPVMTSDYDFWLHIDDIEKFNRAFDPLDFVTNRSPEEARRSGRYVLEDGEHVDVLVAVAVTTVDGVRVEFDAVWQRREEDVLDVHTHAYVPCIDDLIATKMFAARARDLEDVRLLRVRQGQGA